LSSVLNGLAAVVDSSVTSDTVEGVNPRSRRRPSTATMTSAGSPTQVDLTAPAAPTEEPSRPIYKKWWFWVGSAAAVLVVGGVIAASVNKPPHTPLGTYIPTFM
jgi:hypothetical protein